MRIPEITEERVIRELCGGLLWLSIIGFIVWIVLSVIGWLAYLLGW